MDARQYMRHRQKSQDTVLVLPYKIAMQLRDDSMSLQPLPYRKVDDATLQDWRKTADAVAQPPWGLLRAQIYLNDMCDLIASGRLVTPVALKFIFENIADSSHRFSLKWPMVSGSVRQQMLQCAKSGSVE